MNWKIVLAALICNIIFMSASYTMLIPFLPVYLVAELGVAPGDVNIWAGIVFSVTFVVSGICAPVWGKLADTKGKRLMALRASFLLSVSYFLCGIVTTPEELMFARLFQGFASGLWPMDLAIMTLYAPPDRLGFCLGIMQGTLTFGGVVGPLLGGLLAEFFGMRFSFFIGGAALFASFLIFVFVIKEPPVAAEKSAVAQKNSDGETKLWRIPLIRHMLLCGMLVQTVILIMQPIITTYITELAGETEKLMLVSGAVFSLGGIAGAFSAPFWGKFGQKRGFFKAMFFSMTTAGVAMILQGMPHSLMLFAAMQFVVGLFFAGIHPSINAVLAENTPPTMKGRIFGILFAAQQAGSVAGPILGAFVATYFGMNHVFYLAGFILLVLGASVHTMHIRG